MKLLDRIFILCSLMLLAIANIAFAKPADYPKTGLMKIYYDAVNNNSDLAAAKAQYGAKQEIVPQARSGLLPQINAGANYDDVRTVLDTPAATIKRNTYTYGVSLSQPLFRVDRWFQLQAANASSEQARLEFAVAQQQLILNTAQVYFAILQAQDNLAANKAEENAYKRQADEAQAKFKLGLADKTDYLQAKAAYDMSRASRIVAQKSVYDTFQALTTLTNKQYEAIEGMRHNLPITLPIPNDAQAWVNKAVNQNLSLQAGVYGVNAAEETLKQRKAGHSPTVDFVASYKKGDNDAFKFSNSAASSTHYGSEVSQKTVGIELQVPLYSGGMTSSQVREARSTLNMTEQHHESLRRKVVQNTRDYHRSINTDIEQIHALKLSIISSQSAVEATQIGFESGTKDIVDVLDAQQRLYEAVRNYNNARYAYVIDVLNLKLYVGSLSPADLQELEAYLNPNYNPDKDFLPTDVLNNHLINNI